MKKIALSIIGALLCTAAFAQQTPEMDNTSNIQPIDGVTVDIKTTMGDIKAVLYNDTPLHRDNFIKLAKEGTYDGVLFHRVIDQFMVQTGDITSPKAEKGQELGSGDIGYTIEAEIRYPKHFHKYGALAAARTADQVNPEFRSSGSQFYIVTGQKFNEPTLAQLEQRNLQGQMEREWVKLQQANMDKIRATQQSGDKEALEALRQELIKELETNFTPVPFTPEMKEAYTTVGGTPHLDGTYTVFGEVVEGMDVVEKIQKAATDANDRPLEDIRVISVTVEK